jgi:hypothetical protein
MSEDNPFEDLEDEVGDRGGDPFEHLDAESDETQGDSPKRAELPWEDQMDPEELTHDQSADQDSKLDGPTESTASGEPESNPLSRDGTETGPEIDPASDVSREGDPFDSMEDTFTERGVDKVDTETVWKQLTDAKSRGSVTEKQDRTYAKVSKHSYCEQCEYFSDPPDISCSHEGTEIVEFLDVETVRVVDCPVVARRKELEDS